MNNITKPSKRFAILFQIIFYAYPVAMLCLWLWVDPASPEDWWGLELVDTIMDGQQFRDLEAWQRVSCFSISMLTGGAVMYVFRSLARLFNLYAQGAFFGAESVACYRAIGCGLIIQQILSLPEGALLSMVLSWTNPEGERLVSVTVDDANISMIVVGLMVILISRIMDEGRKMQEEQELTV